MMEFISRLVRVVFIIGIFTRCNMEVIDPQFEEDLTRFVEHTMNCRHVPGLTLSIVKGDETWARGYGFADLPFQRKVDNSTIFNIGSVTKSFTMLLLGILLEEKKMDWTTKVSEILDADYEFIDEYMTKEMTLRDLLSHRTGLARIDIGLIGGYPDVLSRERYCKKLKYLPKALPFRDTFLYNNHMYALLGHISEKLGGTSWEQLVTSRIFEPIGMTSSRILRVPSDVMGPDVAHPIIYKDDMYQKGTENMYSLHPVEPAGAILSNGEDMARYMRFYLNKRKTSDGNQLISEKMLLKAWRTTMGISDDPFRQSTFLTEPDFPISDVTMGYGYAWFTSSYRGNERIWHSGGLFSYITYLWLFPDKNIGLFVSANGPGFKSLTPNAEKPILYHVTDYLLGKTSWINETTSCEFPDLWRHKPTNSTPDEPTIELSSPEEYVGEYGNRVLPTIKVTTDPSSNETLNFQLEKVGGVLHSTPDKDRFLMEITSPWEIMTSSTDDNNNTVKVNATFKREDGKVNAVEMQFEVEVLFEKGIDVADMIIETSGAYTITRVPYVIVNLCLITCAAVINI